MYWLSLCGFEHVDILNWLVCVQNMCIGVKWDSCAACRWSIWFSCLPRQHRAYNKRNGKSAVVSASELESCAVLKL